MAEASVKCVKIKSDRRNVYRMNEFYGIHCNRRRKRKKSTSPCLVAGMSRACRGRHGEVGIMEFGLKR